MTPQGVDTLFFCSVKEQAESELSKIGMSGKSSNMFLHRPASAMVLRLVERDSHSLTTCKCTKFRCL